MSLVKIEVVFADEQSIGIQLGRVPLEGEKIEIEDDIYEVRKLLHTPAESVDQYVAVVTVGVGQNGSHPAQPFDIKINMGN